MNMNQAQVSEMLHELKQEIKFSILIDDVEVYVTDIIYDNSGQLRVEFVSQHPEREAEIRPHVTACIMKLISEEEQKQCKSSSRFSRILSKIKNILR
ncbi:head assembly protein [Vibrio phage 1.081.O._10N.286.52.C2]|nr:head assembly protein [Vibrio phage 1.081.O._10N.286.52.C2]